MLIRCVQFSCLLALFVSIASAQADTLVRGDWTLAFSGEGSLLSLVDKQGHELIGAQGGGAVRLGIVDPTSSTDTWRGDAARFVSCRHPVLLESQKDSILCEYDLRPEIPVRVRYLVELTSALDTPVLKQMITLIPIEPPLAKDVVLSVDLVFVPDDEVKVFAPRQDGIGVETPLTPGQYWTWPLDGEARPVTSPDQQLAIPMISVMGQSSSIRLTFIADPFFCTSFRPVHSSNKHAGSFDCIFLGSKAPLLEPVTRTYWTVLHSGSPDDAMRFWYATALVEVPEGPDWLHDIAWQDYDYLSHGGKGWFEDIDAVEERVPTAERGKILFALHGWYDLLGRYSFDAASGKLDDAWTAFPNAPAVKDKFPNSESVAMTKEEMHRRIRYAKDRGLRVCIYFADGLAACEEANIYAEDKLLQWGGWQGPDTIGKTYVQNPGHPEVYAWYVAYLRALLAEYGQEIDALCWDETFMIRSGMMGPMNAGRSTYLCASMMRLVHELTQMTTAYRKELAFLVSDCVGMSFDEKKRWTDVPPYAIMAHGCYQDSHSRPSAWPYGIFPNLRNVLWSCNWNAVTRFDYTKFGVEHYATPIATSNGWLDDKGVARLSEAELNAVLTLFDHRKNTRQDLHWLSGAAPTFEPTPK